MRPTAPRIPRRTVLRAGLAGWAASQWPFGAHGASGDPPAPYLPGARWEYSVSAPVLGEVGTAVRTLDAPWQMSVRLDLTTGRGRSGTYHYRLAASAGFLVVGDARFEPVGGGKGWHVVVDPGLPLFPVAGCPRNQDRVVKLALADGRTARTAQARIKTLERAAEANGFGDLHRFEVEGDALDPFPERAEMWVSDEAGVVRSRIRLSSLLTVTWDLRAWRPARHQGPR